VPDSHANLRGFEAVIGDHEGLDAGSTRRAPAQDR
jgi:hypothetical protein